MNKAALALPLVPVLALLSCGDSSPASGTGGASGGKSVGSYSTATQGGTSQSSSASSRGGSSGAGGERMASSAASSLVGGRSTSDSSSLGGGTNDQSSGPANSAGATLPRSQSVGGSSASTAVLGGAGGSSSLGADGQAGSAGGRSSSAGSTTGRTTSPSSGKAGNAGSTGGCGGLNPNPFGCKFAWGLSANLSGSLAAFSYLQFMTIWIETSIKADGTFTSCSGCNWLKNSVAPTNLIPVYYGYIIGFLGHANGYVDGNQCPANNPNCPNLTTGGGALVKSKRAQIVNAYAEYAKQSYAVWPSKPLVWLLEGDFIQYNDAGQSNPLSMAELVQLAGDITCAIKSNMPNAVVAINHTVWNSDQETRDFWNGLKAVNYDMVWTTGVANNNGFIPAGTNAGTYNAGTAKYSVIHQLTGKPIYVDSECGANTNEDWSRGPASVLNARIADGVIAFGHCVTQAPSNFQAQIAALMPQANPTCH